MELIKDIEVLGHEIWDEGSLIWDAYFHETGDDSTMTEKSLAQACDLALEVLTEVSLNKGAESFINQSLQKSAARSTEKICVGNGRTSSAPSNQREVSQIYELGQEIILQGSLKKGMESFVQKTLQKGIAPSLPLQVPQP